MSHEVSGDEMGEQFKGYIFKIKGGNDKQGFPMMQGVLTTGRVRLLLNERSKCYRAKRKGERKRRSVRGCIVSNEIAVVSLVVVKKGDKDIEGLTDEVQKKRLGPKRANNIRKMFNLSKEDDVRQYVLRRDIMKDGKKVGSKAPKIQRLITPSRLQRKRRRMNQRKQRYQNATKQALKYEQLLQKKKEEKRTKA